MRKFIPNSPEKINMPVIIAGGVILALIVGLIAVYPRDDSSAEYRKMEEKIGRLESRIASLEATNAQQMRRVEAAQRAMENFTETFQQFQALPLEFEGLQKKIEFLNTRQGNLEERLASTAQTVKKKLAAAPPARKTSVTQKTSTSKSKTYHEVQPSETLFSIGQRYDLSVSALRRLNNLTENDVIQPGQRLLVTP